MDITQDFNAKRFDGLADALLNSRTIGVFIYQDDCRIVHSNKAFRDFIGYSEDELSRLTPYDIVGDEYKPIVKKLAERRIKGEVFAAEQITHMHITKAGESKPTVIFAYTISYNGKPAGLVLVLDVSKQKMYDSLILSFRSLQAMYATLSEVNQLIVRTKDENSLFSQIPNRIIQRGLFVNSFIVLFDSNLNIKTSFSYEKSDYLDFLKRHLNSNDPEIKKGPLFTSLLKSKIVINNDTLKNPHMLPWRDEQAKRGYLSSAAVPIIKKGKAIGVLSLYASESGFFKKDVYGLLKEMTMDINYALDKIEDEKWHSMIMTALNSGSDFVVISDKYFNILFANESVYKIFGYSASELTGGHYSKIFGGGSGKRGFAEKFLGTIISGDVLTDIFMYKTKSGGDIYCYTTITPFKFGSDGGGDIQYFITTGKDITREIKAEETMERLMHFDTLTDLPNKKMLKENIDAFIKDAGYSDAHSCCALAIINPVNFSLINHTFGFETGNKIIVEMSHKIKNIIKNYDILARWEADKFAVFLKRLKFDEDALPIVNRIIDVLNEPYAPDGKKINISFNAGISLYPKDAATSQDIFDKAESALLNSRSKGENTVGFFKKEFEESARKKVELRNGLNEAVAKNQFVLHYQPYFDIKQAR
ncbi:MAG: diguanylate cyclase [Deltaproteobacteria bacterium]|jgi:diguanylate cyclase (GGDEF)-like protein/PAS domain S-box-containing protein|nr:diguanylate cyclase [Deltaproteobacteria bacterium]